MKPLSPEITCADGVKLSVQGSSFHYCTPRRDQGPYTEVEVGFPSIRPPRSWREFCEDWKRPTDTVYACVPVAMVLRFIKRHGGIKTGAMP